MRHIKVVSPHINASLFGGGHYVYYYNKSDERESPQKHSLQWKIAASVFLKVFISGDERCHTTDAP